MADAESALQSGDAQQAIAHYTKAIELSRKPAGLLDKRGQVYLGAGDAERALADFDAAIAADPLLASAWRNRGRLRQQANQFEAAAADYSQALALQPADVASISGRGICRAHLHQFADAIADFDKALELNPRLAPIFQARGFSHLQLGHAEQAAGDFHQADLFKAPLAEHAVAWCQALVTLKKYTDAERIADRALKESPENVDLSFVRGRIRLAAKEYEGAIADFDRVLARDPQRNEALLARGSARSAAGQLAEARNDYSQYLAGDPQHQPALRARARLSLLLNDPAAAKTDCDAWLATDKKLVPSDWAAVMTYRALASHRLGDWRAAEEDAGAARQADPKRHDATCILALARLASGGTLVGDDASAAQLLTELIHTYPEDPRLLNLRAIVYLLHGDVSLAAADGVAAEKLSGDKPVGIACRAAVKLRQGKFAEALAILKQAPPAESTAGYSARRLPELLAPKFAGAAESPGWRAFGAGQWLTAVEETSQALNKQPSDATLLLLRGAAETMLGDRNRALADYQRAISATPANDALGHHLRALVEIEKGGYAQGASEALNALRLAPADARLYATHLLASAGQEDWQEAQIDIEIVAALDPDSLSAILPLRGSWSRPGSDSVSIPLGIELVVPPRLLTQSIDATGGEPKDRGFQPRPYQEPGTEARGRAASILVQAGNTYYLAAKNERAIERYDLAILLGPRPEWLAARGAAHYARRDFSAAVADFTQAIEQQPKVSSYYFNRANAYLNQQAIDQALADYSRVIELEPDGSEAYRHRAKVYALRKEDAKAEADLERARKLRIEGK